MFYFKNDWDRTKNKSLQLNVFRGTLIKLIWININFDVINIFIMYFNLLMYLFIRILVRNVIVHSLCIVCIWILWWSQTLCSWEQMIRWMTLKNLVLEDVGTQYSDRMWPWGWVFTLIAWCYFSLFYLTDLTKFLL